jgi:hypothetical protein
MIINNFVNDDRYRYMNKDEKDKYESWKGLEKFAHLGFTVGLSVFAFGYLGSFIDKKLGTKWVFTAIGFLWGFAGSFGYLYFYLKKNDTK